MVPATSARRIGTAAVVLAVLASAALSATLSAAIPGPLSVAEAAAPAQHVVKPGETLSSIARLHHTSSGALATYNGLSAPYAIHRDALLRLTKPARALPAFSSTIRRVSASQLGATYRAGCPVPPSRLRSVRLTHYTFSGTAGTGELIVHESVADPTVAVFRSLYARRFPVQRIVPASAYGGSDEASMAANNTSAYNCRLKTGSSRSYSEHSYGRALDVNPVQNPYVRGRTVLPTAGTAYTDRRLYRTGMVHAGGTEAVFRARGFFWGGRWRSFQDYQHFSTTNR